MLPSHPYATSSKAEKRVFDCLKEAFHPHHEEYIALHSFKLSQHAYKRSAEIDFLICCPYGIFFLEVKGGRVNFDGQRWGFVNKNGQEDISFEGPFRQAESAMYSFRERLQQQLTKNIFKKIIFGYGVVFPDSNLISEFFEWDKQLLCAGGQHHAIENWLRQLMEYWQAKEKTPQKLSFDEVSLLVGVLRPKQTSDVNLYSQIEWANEKIKSFTEQQLLLLDAVEANPRVLCAGSAGTGKTFMAMELAQRWTSEGKKVLLICRSQWLKNFLMAGFRLPNLTISTLEALTITVRRAGIENYDALLVDEGQDVLDVELFNQVEAYLSGGFKLGRWVFFHDINNQAGLFGKVDEKVFSKLELLAPVQIPLRRNCRNTANVLDVIREYTGADMGVEAVGAGPIVKIAEASSTTQLISLLKKSVVEILDYGGLPAAELTILTDKSPMCFVQNVAKFLPYKVALLDEYSMQHFPPNAVSLTSIDAFKGLENTAIILCLDKNNFKLKQQKLLLYVGMSRARVLLHIIFK